MKKLLMSLTVVVLSTMAVKAQTSFGIKAGLNISNLHGKDVVKSDYKSLIGANGGVYAHIPVSTTFAVQPELLYSLEGAKAKDNDGRIELDYINLPVMLQYVNPSGFYAELGPQVGFLTTAKAKSGGVSVDVKNDLKSINFSVGAGLGYNFTPNVGAGIRYTLGLTTIDDSTPKSEVKTGNLAIGIHYTFGK